MHDDDIFANDIRIDYTINSSSDMMMCARVRCRPNNLLNLVTCRETSSCRALDF